MCAFENDKNLQKYIKLKIYIIKAEKIAPKSIIGFVENLIPFNLFD